MQVKKNILILTYWSYKDALIQTYTLPYVRIIRKIIPLNSKVILITFENKFHILHPQEKIKIKKALANENISWISNSYSNFGIISISKNIFTIAKLLIICILKKITYIHAWCAPAGSIGYFLSKITNIPLIIDSYEPHAEAMAENGTWMKNGIAFRTLFYFEKLLSKHALVTIATSQGMKEYAKEKYNVKLSNFFVKPACVDYNLFSPPLSPQNKKKGEIVCVYAGKFGGIYLKQEVFDFLKVAYLFWGEKFRILFLTDTPKNEIEEMAKKSHIDHHIITTQFVAHTEIPKYLALADFAINPVKPVPTKRYCTSIKDGEYWAMGLPIVITANISDDSNIIEENNIGAVIHSLDNESYLSAIKKIDNILHSPSLQKTKMHIRELAKKIRGLEIAESIYKNIYQ